MCVEQVGVCAVEAEVPQTEARYVSPPAFCSSSSRVAVCEHMYCFV